jgi:hypothetical protein
MILKKSKRSSFLDISREWMLEGKREKVSRFTQQHVSQVGMVNILKSNMYSLQDGEPSVFEKETTSRALTAAANGEKPHRRGVVRYHLLLSDFRAVIPISPLSLSSCFPDSSAPSTYNSPPSFSFFLFASHPFSPHPFSYRISTANSRCGLRASGLLPDMLGWWGTHLLRPLPFIIPLWVPGFGQRQSVSHRHIHSF